MSFDSPRAKFAFSLLSIALTACGSQDKGTSKTGASSTEADAGPLYLGLATPMDGFQLRSVGADIGPGDEREYCEVARLPGGPTDEYYVSSIELANAKFSHHLGLGVVTPGSAAETEVAAVGVGNRQACPGPSIEFGEGIEIVATIQVPYGKTELPAGVARKYVGGQYIVFDYHYANTGLDVVQARSAVNFHLVDSATMEHVARTFFLNNLTIDTPAGQVASFTGECHFDHDMLVGALTRHTHRLGTDFSVWYAGGAHDREEIWTSHDWEHETEYTFAEPALVRAGDGFRYECTYKNDTTGEVRFGTNVKDEMCTLYGPAWSPGGAALPVFPGCTITWVDAAGIGHPADEAGGFPKPVASDAASCEGYFGSSIDDCNKCRCDSCATPILKCIHDADCSPFLLCSATCTDMACFQNCASLAHTHSAGEGLLTQAAACVSTECPVCGSPIGTSGTGAP